MYPFKIGELFSIHKKRKKRIPISLKKHIYLKLSLKIAQLVDTKRYYKRS
jgi:hypothetical protein